MGQEEGQGGNGNVIDLRFLPFYQTLPSYPSEETEQLHEVMDLVDELGMVEAFNNSFSEVESEGGKQFPAGWIGFILNRWGSGVEPSEGLANKVKEFTDAAMAIDRKALQWLVYLSWNATPFERNFDYSIDGNHRGFMKIGRQLACFNGDPFESNAFEPALALAADHWDDFFPAVKYRGGRNAELSCALSMCILHGLAFPTEQWRNSVQRLLESMCESGFELVKLLDAEGLAYIVSEGLISDDSLVSMERKSHPAGGSGSISSLSYFFRQTESNPYPKWYPLPDHVKSEVRNRRPSIIRVCAEQGLASSRLLLSQYPGAPVGHLLPGIISGVSSLPRSTEIAILLTGAIRTAETAASIEAAAARLPIHVALAFAALSPAAAGPISRALSSPGIAGFGRYLRQGDAPGIWMDTVVPPEPHHIDLFNSLAHRIGLDDIELGQTWYNDYVSRPSLSAKPPTILVSIEGDTDVLEYHWNDEKEGRFTQEEFERLKIIEKRWGWANGYWKPTPEPVLIKAKRGSQAAFVLLGLLPIDDPLNRYKLIRQYLKKSRDYGAQRAGNERRCLIGALELAARQLGYGSGAAYEWAMEAVLADELLDESDVKVGQYEFTVQFIEGRSRIAASKEGKALRSIPKSVRAVPEFAALKESTKSLDEQFRRYRNALEEAMVCQAPIPSSHLVPLLKTRSLRWLAERVLFGSRDGEYGAFEGRHYTNLLGAEPKRAVPPDELFVVHPAFIDNSELIHLRGRFVSANLRQPFPQLWRETYQSDPLDLGRIQQSVDNPLYAIQGLTAMHILKGRQYAHDGAFTMVREFRAASTRAELEFNGQASFLAQNDLPMWPESIRFKRFDGDEWVLTDPNDIEVNITSELYRDVDYLVHNAQIFDGGELLKESTARLKLKQSLLEHSIGNLPGISLEYQGHNVLANLGGRVVYVNMTTAKAHYPAEGEELGQLDENAIKKEKSRVKAMMPTDRVENTTLEAAAIIRLLSRSK